MNIMKFATAVLTAGLIAAGAGVSAYQAPGKKQAGFAIDPRAKKAETHADPITETFKAELPGPAPGDGNPASGAESEQTVASLAQARYQEAARMLERAVGRLQISIPSRLTASPSIPGRSRRWRPGATSAIRRPTGSPPRRTI